TLLLLKVGLRRPQLSFLLVLVENHQDVTALDDLPIVEVHRINDVTDVGGDGNGFAGVGRTHCFSAHFQQAWLNQCHLNRRCSASHPHHGGSTGGSIKFFPDKRSNQYSNQP